MNLKIKLLSFVKKLLLVDWVNTIRVNSKLPFKQFVKMPILVYGCKIDKLNSIKIQSSNIQFGMIRLGLRTIGLCGNKNSINLKISGGGDFQRTWLYG